MFDPFHSKVKDLQIDPFHNKVKDLQIKNKRQNNKGKDPKQYYYNIHIQNLVNKIIKYLLKE